MYLLENKWDPKISMDLSTNRFDSYNDLEVTFFLGGDWVSLSRMKEKDGFTNAKSLHWNVSHSIVKSTCTPLQEFMVAGEYQLIPAAHSSLSSLAAAQTTKTAGGGGSWNKK